MGGGIHINKLAKCTTCYMNNITISGNIARIEGGGLYIKSVKNF